MIIRDFIVNNKTLEHTQVSHKTKTAKDIFISKTLVRSIDCWRESNRRRVNCTRVQTPNNVKSTKDR